MGASNPSGVGVVAATAPGPDRPRRCRGSGPPLSSGATAWPLTDPEADQITYQLDSSLAKGNTSRVHYQLRNGEEEEPPRE